jgi:Ca2+-binding RTX toxin-like protein
MDIYRASLRGAVRRLTVLGRNFDPSWSPDGRTIAFVSRRDGNLELYTMSWDGSNQTRITSTPGAESSPDWSPDGRRLVFVRGPDLWVRDIGTGRENRLTRTPHVETEPVWSPNGRLVAFTRVSGGALFVRDMQRESVRKIVADVGGNLSWQPRCTMIGTRGPNFLVGTTRRELICAGGGNDFVTARGRRDAVFGGSGNDRLLGGSGDDVLVGGSGRDVLVGGPGRDFLSAVDRRGGDVVRGGPDDLCRADSGDTVVGC